MSADPVDRAERFASWTGESLGGKDAVVVETGAEFDAAFDALAAKLKGRAFPDIAREDASDPAIVARDGGGGAAGSITGAALRC